jgi:hypothetical protein
LFFSSKERLNLVAKGVGVVNDGLGLFAIIPEIFDSHQRIQFADAFLGLFDVKETSANAKVFPRR